jgi:tetratricopeptide (TPR) repeat protein
MLPSKPKIFHGRESELDSIMKILTQQSPRIAILGGGGMGKTSLARAVLHHPDTSAKFEHRFFVSAETASTSIELAAIIGLHIGLSPGEDLTKPIVQHFSRKPFCLLILDNLETVWEPMQSRGEIEEFLSLLTDVEHLGVIVCSSVDPILFTNIDQITMRGAERPAKVHWTHPFLLPLGPLSDTAAQQTILDITDNLYEIEDIDQLLKFTDNLPLAVDLIAHLVDYEGLHNVLARWETEKTSLLSIGYDRKSNLDASIKLSLSSPRITSDSKELLSLLSILPDGLSDAELVQSNLPLPNILSCKTALLATSLAYQDSNRRLRSLMPVREHIQKFLPLSLDLVQCLCKMFYSLLELYQKYDGEQLGPVIHQITLNLANLHEVLKQGLYTCAPDLGATICTILSLNSFYRLTGRGLTALMECIQPMLCGLDDGQVEIRFITEVLRSHNYCPALDRRQLITQAIQSFEHINYPLLECKYSCLFQLLLISDDHTVAKFYYAAGTYFLRYTLDVTQPMHFYNKALKLANMCADSYQQCGILIQIALLKWSTGDYCTAQVHATEAQRLTHFSANLYQEAGALWVGSQCSRSLGCFQQSIDQLKRSRTILGICGLVGGALDNRITFSQGEIHHLKSEYAQARSIYSQIVEGNSSGQNAHTSALSLLNIAQIDTICGDTRDVYHKLNQARNLYSSHGFPIGLIYCSLIEADIKLEEGNFDVAMAEFQRCLRSAWGTDSEIESLCLEKLANIRAWPTSEMPNRWPVMYCGHAYKLKEKLALHKALLFLGDDFIANEDEETAANLYTVALEGLTHMDIHWSRAQCMIRLGDLAEGQGHTSKAISFWMAARPLFEQALQAKDVAQIDARLSVIEKAQQKALPTLTTFNAPDQLSTKKHLSTRTLKL